MATRTAGNITITFNAVSLECDVTQFNFSAEGNRIDTTALCDTGAKSITGFTDYSIELTGLTDIAVDNLFGPKVGDGTKYTTAFAITDTVASQTVTYTWTAAGAVGGEVESYNLSSNVNEAHGWSATIRLSGSPVRAVA